MVFAVRLYERGLTCWTRRGRSIQNKKNIMIVSMYHYHNILLHNLYLYID